MNAERLLAHYERIADAPDAIERLRRFVLDLAVRGKLVPQDTNDEPASELLKRIAAEKARLVKEGKIKPDRTGKARSTEIVPFDLPSGWTWTDLQTICISITDGDHLPPPKSAGGVPFLVISDVRTRTINYSPERFVSREYYDGLDPTRQPRKGDLLYTLVGSFGIPIEVSSNKEFCVQRHIGILRPSEIIPVSFVARTMKSEFAFRQTEACATGIAQKTVPLSGLRKLTIPFPPLPEQHRIVAKVDELMALCGRLEAARADREAIRDKLTAASYSRLNVPDPETFHDDARFAIDALPALTTRPDQIKQLRQTILNLAVRGKLVPQNPNEEPASELLTRIGKEKRNSAPRARQRRNGSIDGLESIPAFKLPESWTWTNLGELALEMRYGTSKKCDYEIRGAPVLRIPNVSGGKISLDDLKFGPLTTSEIKELSLRRGDLLVIRSNGSLDIVGRVAEVDQSAEGMSFAGYLVRVRLSVDSVLPRFIWRAMNTDHVRDQIEKPIRSAVGLKNVNSTELAALSVPLPPFAEQHRIVAKVDELMALCDRLEASLTTAAHTHSRLLDALLAEALTPDRERELEAAE